MQRKHLGFSQIETERIWDAWREGETHSSISRMLNSNPGSVYRVIAENGGVQPTPRKRNKNSLTPLEREEISRKLSAGFSMRIIAYHLKRAASTISREISRNGGIDKYRACSAEENAWKHAKRPKKSYLQINHELYSIVTDKLELKWAPQQISGWLKTMYADDRSMWISHETIYKSLFIQSKGVLKKSLQKHLRTKRMMRRPKHAKVDRLPRGRIIDAVSIRERPANIEDRAVPGHWEGDLISGSNNTHMATLVERKSRFTMLVKVKGKDTVNVIAGLKDKIKTLPLLLRQTLTWDRGMELANHKELSIDTNIKIYFCDPKSPWQRGTNENTNGLLRQYFPKKTDLSIHSQESLDLVAEELNNRPRKTLNFSSPVDILRASVAMTD